MNDITKNIKTVMIIFLVLFIGLISYITYFEVFVGPKIVNNASNKRLWVQRNEVLRGTVYDRDMTALTESKRIDEDTQAREYTYGSLFAHAIGYVDIKYGITGLERKYDSELIYSSIKDNIMNFIKYRGELPEKVGNSIRTTLDYDVQKKAYDLLGSNRGAVVVLNPQTGEILALVSKPSYDPNSLDEDWEDINSNADMPLINRATAGLYPPGSTFKVITAASAIENISGIMDRTFEDNGKIVFNDNESLSNYGGEVLGDISFEGAFVHSSNVVFGTLGMELGNGKLKDTAEAFNFNADTPADGVTIENSVFPSFGFFEKGNIAQSAIGQSEVLATPMEMALVASTVANGGVMMKPYIVSQVMTSSGDTVKTIEPGQIRQVISADTASIIKDFMRKVVTDGTGTNAAVSGIEVCGKTGTADHAEGSEPHSWFIGFAPYDNPQVAVAVIVEEGGTGGGLAAKIAGQVMQAALSK
ncbi:MAG: penicillin-binding protein [Firmicutes bacterium]|nr:penicillin-binding protein [Bacillota bacterium]